MLIDRKTLQIQFKRISQQKQADGVWLKADADQVAASIKAALDSGDADRIQAVVDYLAAEYAEVAKLDARVASANERLRALAEINKEAKAKVQRKAA